MVYFRFSYETAFLRFLNIRNEMKKTYSHSKCVINAEPDRAAKLIQIRIKRA